MIEENEQTTETARRDGAAPGSGKRRCNAVWVRLGQADWRIRCYGEPGHATGHWYRGEPDRNPGYWQETPAALYQSNQACDCGWKLPRPSMVAINVHADPGVDEYSVNLEILCPDCGKSFVITDLDVEVVH